MCTVSILCSLFRWFFLPGTAMTSAAAVTLSSSRGVADVRTCRGLFFILTLLCLVSLSCSLTDRELVNFLPHFLHICCHALTSICTVILDLQEKLKEDLHKIEQTRDRVTVIHFTGIQKCLCRGQGVRTKKLICVMWRCALFVPIRKLTRTKWPTFHGS